MKYLIMFCIALMVLVVILDITKTIPSHIAAWIGMGAVVLLCVVAAIKAIIKKLRKQP